MDRIEILKKRAESMKQSPTFAEATLKKKLETRFFQLQFFPYWEFQKVIAPYIADFVFTGKKLIVEIDGDFHDNNTDQQTHDTKRDIFLMDLGFTVWRFKNAEIIKDAGEICNKILNFNPTYRTKHFYRDVKQNNALYLYSNILHALLSKRFRGIFIACLHQEMHHIIVWRYFNGFLPEKYKEKQNTINAKIKNVGNSKQLKLKKKYWNEKRIEKYFKDRHKRR